MKASVKKFIQHRKSLWKHNGPKPSRKTVALALNSERNRKGTSAYMKKLKSY